MISDEKDADLEEQEANADDQKAVEESTAATESKDSVDKKSSPQEEDGDSEEEESEDEPLDNLDDLTGIDDPLAPAFDLERGAPLEPYEEVMPWQTKVASAKEFFNTEVLYRFDIIEPDEVKPLEGTYRIELNGEDGGVWSLKIGNQIDVSNSNEDADTVLKMHQRDFLAIVNGKLNPQLAILAQKVKVKGEVKKAIRLQEILGPSSE